MSLINQMLKDLDSRRGPSDGAHLAALQGMGLASVNQVQWQNAFPVAAWLLGGLLTLFILLQSLPVWFGTVEPAVTPPAELQAVAGKNTAEPGATPRVDTATTDTVQQKVETPLSGLTPVPANITPVEHKTVNENEVTARMKPAAADTTPQKLVSPPSQPAPAPAQEQTQTQTSAVSTRIAKLTPAQRTRRLLADAQRAIDAQQLRRGELILSKILDETPSHLAARIQLADVLVEQGRVTEGEQLLAEGLLMQPNKPELAGPYARLLAARGALSPALEVLDGTVDRNQPEAQSMALRAAILYRLKRHGESVTAYRQALREQPYQALWWTGLAVALEHDHQPVQALQAYRRAVNLPLEKPVNAYVKQRIHALGKSETLY